MAQYRTVPKPKKNPKKRNKMLIAGWKSAGFTVQKIQAGYTPPFAAGWWFFARTVGTKKDSLFFLTCFHEFCFIGLNWFHWWMNLSKKFGSFTSRSGRLLLQQAVEAAEVRCELWWLMDRWLPCDPNEISVKLENLRIVVILSAQCSTWFCNFGSKLIQTTLAGWNFGTKGSCPEGTNQTNH